MDAEADPYVPPSAALRDTPDDGAAARRRMLYWGIAAVILLGLVSVGMFWFISAFEQVFKSFGADVPSVTRIVMNLRAAWVVLPLAALLLTIGGAKRPAPVFAPARVTRWLIALLIGSLFLISFGWCVMYLPIFKLGEAI